MRVVIAEDNVLLSSGVELLLAAKGIDVPETATDGPGFVAPRCHPLRGLSRAPRRAGSRRGRRSRKQPSSSPATTLS
ncbi:response regulator, partial [Nonomuraea sp. NPDC055795]